MTVTISQTITVEQAISIGMGLRQLLLAPENNPSFVIPDDKALGEYLSASVKLGCSVVDAAQAAALPAFSRGTPYELDNALWVVDPTMVDGTVSIAKGEQTYTVSAGESVAAAILLAPTAAHFLPLEAGDFLGVRVKSINGNAIGVFANIFALSMSTSWMVGIAINETSIGVASVIMKNNDGDVLFSETVNYPYDVGLRIASGAIIGGIYNASGTFVEKGRFTGSIPEVVWATALMPRDVGGAGSCVFGKLPPNAALTANVGNTFFNRITGINVIPAANQKQTFGFDRNKTLFGSNSLAFSLLIDPNLTVAQRQEEAAVW